MKLIPVQEDRECLIPEQVCVSIIYQRFNYDRPNLESELPLVTSLFADKFHPSLQKVSFTLEERRYTPKYWCKLID